MSAKASSSCGRTRKRPPSRHSTPIASCGAFERGCLRLRASLRLLAAVVEAEGIARSEIIVLRRVTRRLMTSRRLSSSLRESPRFDGGKLSTSRRCSTRRLAARTIISSIEVTNSCSVSSMLSPDRLELECSDHAFGSPLSGARGVAPRQAHRDAARFLVIILLLIDAFRTL